MSVCNNSDIGICVYVLEKDRKMLFGISSKKKIYKWTLCLKFGNVKQQNYLMSKS